MQPLPWRGRRPLAARVVPLVILLSVAAAVVLLFTGRIPSAPPRFHPQTVIAKPAPAITNPPTVSAAEADRTLHESELVLGVTIGQQSRAYPINMLTGPSREIINDQLGGRAIAATW